MAVLDTLFGQGSALAWWQECDRALLVFVYGLAVIRLVGRRIFGKWAALDIIVSIVAGSNLSRAITGSAELFPTLAATSLLVLVHRGLAVAAARWSFASFLVEGRPEVLARDGVVFQDLRLRHAVTQADLDEALRKVSVADAAETRAVTLEPSGTITVLKR